MMRYVSNKPIVFQSFDSYEFDDVFIYLLHNRNIKWDQ